MSEVKVEFHQNVITSRVHVTRVHTTLHQYRMISSCSQTHAQTQTNWKQHLLRSA